MTAIIEQETDIEQGIISLSDKGMALRVINNDTYQQAGEVLLLHKDMEKNIKGYFKPLKEAAHKSWKGICDAENIELDKLKPVEQYLKLEIGRYQAEQEQIRKAEEDRLRLEALKAEEERRIAAAIQAEAEGYKEEAQEILDTPVFVPPPTVVNTMPTVKGLATKTVWKFRVVNEALIPRQYLTLNEAAIRATVTALKNAAKIPGIEVYQEQCIAAGRR